ncbi:uracil-DNA glycosylase [Nostocoides sp. Soil756]|jgi:uracil-DNA glycosylase family 4|uniref:uracil-DNA glycosylase n=1 Tax=Nostocoides sp. Soil756 TaxID=1736399 RepID=UPI0006F9C278|nr:uracil-DNA glycosylase [Tetrasphaera sp. Soil756]KRE62108.1 uracil-DNA glycosylase [Tetrasphaera sp. Soil756]
MEPLDPHPVTGTLLPSPARPGCGWPGDPADAQTPVATTAAAVRRLARSAADVAELQARVSVCRACPRLVRWRESVATTGRRASFADQPYWGRPGPSFGDADAAVLLVGLAPAANGTNRTGRMFTGDSSGDFLWAALHRTGFAAQPTSVAAGDGQALTGMRIVAAVRCAPPENKPTSAEKETCRAWLVRDLELATPRLRAVLCLGAIGWDAALAAATAAGWEVPRPKPRFGHAAEVVLTAPDGRGIRMVGCYHVSPHNTFTKRLTPAMLDEVLLSLRAG